MYIRIYTVYQLLQTHSYSNSGKVWEETLRPQETRRPCGVYRTGGDECAPLGSGATWDEHCSETLQRTSKISKSAASIILMKDIY